MAVVAGERARAVAGAGAASRRAPERSAPVVVEIRHGGVGVGGKLKGCMRVLCEGCVEQKVQGWGKWPLASS